MRDFPPLVDPNRPAPDATPYAAIPPPSTETPLEGSPGEPVEPSRPQVTIEGDATSGADAELTGAYRLGVGDELQIAVLNEPDMSRTVRVRPDGAITVPGAGSVYALGRAPEDVGREIESRLLRYLRYPRVDLLVSAYGDQRVFVMGEVFIPGDQPYHKGMSALQAVAQAGGIRHTGRTGSVVVLRRVGEEEVLYERLDLGAAMKGDAGEDRILQPYDIVFVPRTFITNVNNFLDQYFRQTTPPFTFYIEGWTAFNLENGRVRDVRAR